jgi:2-polyprenyl-3-methyl-5-hydroxy-6-metoxy-1,4-benzoquinol methylase
MTDVREFLTACPNCAATRFTQLFTTTDRELQRDEDFHVAKCTTCGLVFQHPRVPEEFISEYYADKLNYYNPDTTSQSKTQRISLALRTQTLVNHFEYTHLGKRSWSRKLVTLPMVGALKANLFPTWKTDGTLLEIGCAHGHKLRTLEQLGWNVRGIEMDKHAGMKAKERGLRVNIGRIEDQQFKPGTFDVIIMNMVLEHLYNPFETLAMVSSWLRPGGQLIITIPDIEGVEYKLFGAYSFGLQLPRHIIFPSTDILRKWLTKLGFTTIRAYHQFTMSDYKKSAEIACDKRGSTKDKFLASPFMKILIAPYLLIQSARNKTARLTIHATYRGEKK